MLSGISSVFLKSVFPTSGPSPFVSLQTLFLAPTLALPPLNPSLEQTLQLPVTT